MDLADSRELPKSVREGARKDVLLQWTHMLRGTLYQQVEWGSRVGTQEFGAQCLGFFGGRGDMNDSAIRVKVLAESPDGMIA